MTLGVVNLSYLTDEERDRILDVVKRDDQLRESEQKRIRTLKEEVKSLRLKGTIREGRNAARTCARCRVAFGLIFNTGSVCPKCQHRVCKKCQEPVPSGRWICIFCFRQMEYDAKSGNWFYSKFPRTMRDRATNEVICGGKIVRDAISSSDAADDLDYICDLETPSTNTVAYRNSDSQQTSSVPPVAGDKVATGYKGIEGEMVTQRRSDKKVHPSETSKSPSLETEAGRSLDGDDSVSTLEEILQSFQKDVDAKAAEICRSLKSPNSSCPGESFYPDDVGKVAIAENVHVTTSEIEAQNFDLNSNELSQIVCEDRASVDIDEDGAPVDIDEDRASVDIDEDRAAVDIDEDGASVDIDEDRASVDIDEDRAPVDIDEDGASVDIDADGASVDIDEDRACVDIDGSGKHCDETRNPCGVHDLDGSAFEDDFDRRVDLGNSDSEILEEGSYKDIQTSISPGLRHSQDRLNDRASGAIATVISCDDGHSDHAPVPGAAFVEAEYFPLPCSADSEDARIQPVADSKDSRPHDTPVFKSLSPGDGVCGYDISKSSPASSIAHSNHALSDNLLSDDRELEARNCPESTSQVYETDECCEIGYINESKRSLDGNNEEELFQDQSSSDGSVTEIVTDGKEINCENIISEPKASSSSPQNVVLSEVLEQEEAVGENLEFSDVMDEVVVCRGEQLRQVFGDQVVPGDDLHATFHVPSPPKSVDSAAILEKTVVCIVEDSIHSSTDASGNGGASVRSKVEALLARHGHRLASENRSKDDDRLISGISRDVLSVEHLNGVCAGRVVLSSNRDDEFITSDFYDCFGGSLKLGQPLALSTYPSNFPGLSNHSENILWTNDFNRQTNDGVTSLEGCDLSDGESGSDDSSDTSRGFIVVRADDDLDGDMEWDGIELSRTVRANGRDGRNLEISDDSERQANELSALHSMLSLCLSGTSHRDASGSPPRSLSPTEGCEPFLENPRGFGRGRKSRRRFLSAFSAKLDRDCDRDVKDDGLSVISEHTEPESDGDDS